MPGLLVRALTLYAWPTRSGTLHLALSDAQEREPTDDRLATLLDQGAGRLVMVDDPSLRDRLVEAGGEVRRHLHVMRHDLAAVPPTPELPGLVLRSWRDDDPERLAPAFAAAYGPGHPDEVTTDPFVNTRELAHTADDPDNPLIEFATTVAVVDDEPIGAALVLRSEHHPDWCGPWLMNTFRAPQPAVRGIGAAMVTHAIRALRDAGEGYFGLAVTNANPARRVYERLGFHYSIEGWNILMPS